LRYWSRERSSATTSLDVEPRGGADEQVSELAIIRWHECQAVLAVAIEEPAGQEERRSLVALTKSLRACNPERENTSGLNGVIDRVYRVNRRSDQIKIFRFVEPLVGCPSFAVDGDGQRQRRAPQCSRR
jgi:hypothetical protein